jgi:thiol-disulfide isomerase/thioredoxin
LFLCALTAGAATAPSTRPAGGGASPDAVVLKDIEGVERHPLASTPGGKAAVVIFLAHDCPISNSYAPEINRLCAQYGGDGKFAFSLVHPLAELSADEAKKHAKEYGYTVPVFVDTKHVLTRRLGPKVTPEVAVIDPAGKVLYQGRIDDRWATFGRARIEPTARDLRAALDAILAGKPVPTERTDAVGCPI